MKKAWMLFVLVFAAHWVSADDVVYQTIDDAIKACIGELSKRLPVSIVAVRKIESPDTKTSDRIRRIINAEISNTAGKLTTVSREKELLAALDDELKYQTSDAVNKQTANEIGNEFGVKFFIDVSFIEVENRLFELYITTAEVGTNVTINLIPKKIRGGLSFFRSDGWENSRLYLGLRAGGSPRFYTLSDDIQGEAKTGAAFEGGLQLSVFLYDPIPNLEIGVQTELLFSGDTVSYSGSDDAGDFTASFTSYTLAIPLLAKLSYRIQNRFIIPLFFGPMFTIPLGDIDYSSGNISGSYAGWIPVGFTVGIAPGIKLGPGTLFTDVRFSTDFGATNVEDSSGTLSAYTRSALSFSLGYEIGVIPRK